MSLADAQREFLEGALALYNHLAALGVPIVFHEYYRNREAQDRYYQSGASKAKYGESPHNYGLAADYHWKDYGWSVPDSWWRYVHKIAEQVNIESGVNWNDGNHLQLKGWKQWKNGLYLRA